MKMVSMTAPLLAVALVLASGCREVADRKPVKHTVRIEAMKFSPAVLTVSRGDVVEFSNADVVPHTATGENARRFDSGRIDAARSWTYVADEKGEFRYRCIYHPEMTGVLKVVENAEPELAGAGRSVELCGAAVSRFTGSAL